MTPIERLVPIIFVAGGTALFLLVKRWWKSSRQRAREGWHIVEGQIERATVTAVTTESCAAEIS